MTGSQIYSAAWRAVLVLLTVDIAIVSALRGCDPLRLLIPAVYRVNSWLAWSVNLALVEYQIRRKRHSATTPRASFANA